MAYNFGQFLSSSANEYLSDIPAGSGGYRIKTFRRQDGENYYTDKEIEYQMNSYEAGSCYYLKFKIRKKTEGKQDIIISLAHENSTDSDKQELKIITIPKANSVSDTGYVTFDLVIAPNDNYNEIQFVLSRVASYDDREIDLVVEKYAGIKNIINFLSPSESSTAISKLKQIGVQGPVGLQMCIDGESIEIGRTGIYEINHGYSISFLGFIYYGDIALKPFILDYQY